MFIFLFLLKDFTDLHTVIIIKYEDTLVVKLLFEKIPESFPVYTEDSGPFQPLFSSIDLILLLFHVLEILVTSV